MPFLVMIGFGIEALLKALCSVLVIETIIGLTSTLSVVIEIGYFHTKVEQGWYSWR